MTEKQMHKLADIIMERIKAMQSEMDNDFFRTAEELNGGWTLINTPPEEIPQEINVLIEQLQTNLQEALAQENYELAAILQKKIEDLKNK